ncbi:hypothetical protein [Brumimicrobium oceani]|uniref:Uncharacterized protein n=1 Tax=Brumimicrobium oceani TaxID=2100725 RepID=A0A2U2XE16_9FLAO|nr:hypothetical protein [Brumimicrobium oceani]PWH86034.1 hypothetical protein DIT68_05620 [Brumimicrobium oceani]
MKNDNIGKYLNDFNSLIDTPFMNLDKIEWWLLKYADFHFEITTYYRDNNISYSPNSDIEAHPLYPLIINLHAFLDFYHFLNEISEYARREAYFKEEIKEYQRVKTSKEKSKEWLTKNLKFGLGPYPQFITDANALENDEMIVIHEQHDVIFYLDRKDFSAVLEFIEIFEEVVFEKELEEKELEGFWVGE